MPHIRILIIFLCFECRDCKLLTNYLVGALSAFQDNELSISQVISTSSSNSKLPSHQLSFNMSARKPQFNKQLLYDTTPLPDSIPKVKEIGASSAPLMSASFFIGARCRAYNDDFMQCKTESYGRGEIECLKEGRRVTNCARSVISDINKTCLEEFNRHWQCLNENNHQLWQCRTFEWPLNRCVYNKLGLEKVIPDTPKGEVPVHLRKTQIYANQQPRGSPDLVLPTKSEGKSVSMLGKAEGESKETL